MANTRKGGLGKGLGALISSTTDVERSVPSAPRAPLAASPEPKGLADGSLYLLVNPRELRPNPKQPRQYFDEETLQELAESIRIDGLQEPVIVREKDGEYELVSGERRVRASILAELDAIPAVCREVSDDDMLRLGLIENIQREDLNAIETARAYRALIDDFDWTQDELAAQVGKKRATISNTMRLLNLPEDVQQCVAEDGISMGHARALLALDSATKMSNVCRRIMREGLSVRDVEKITSPRSAAQGPAAAKVKDPHLAAIEDDLRRRLGTKVQLSANADWKGKIEIDFYNLDDLERILEMLRA